MAGGGKTGNRWIVPLLGGLLVASAAVGYALVRITSPSNDGTDEAATSVTSLSSDLMGSTSSLSESTTTDRESTPSAPSESPSAETTQPAPTVPPTMTSDLPGSDVTLPAAWSGTATVTVTVLGDCAAATPSVYTDVPADLALDMVGNEANAAETPLTADTDPAAVSLTLGINPNAMPSLAVYSSQISEDGTLRRFWDLSLVPGPNWTEIRGTLTRPPRDGPNPNMMVDAETSLQPCEAAGTVSLPRALAAGSTIAGWVTRTRANLTLTAVTTDGKRSVEVQIDAQRKQ